VTGRSTKQSSYWLIGALVLGVVFFGIAIVSQLGGGDDGSGEGNVPGATATPDIPANAVAISIASSNTKEAWLHQAVEAFNAASAAEGGPRVDGRPVFVEILQETVDGKAVDYRSGTMVSDTLKGAIEPTIVSPGDVSWLDKLEHEWDAQKGGDVISAAESPILVRTPLVVAMWQSRAAALGCWPTPGPDCTWARLRDLATSEAGWGDLGHPEWRKFRFGYGYFGESNSGTLAISAMCSVGLGKTAGLTVADVEPSNECGRFLADIERAKVHSGKSDVWLLDQMTEGGPEYLDAVVTYESNVIARNKAAGDRMREPMVSVYPQDGTIVVGHPFAVMDGAPWVTDEQEKAAEVFRDYLLSPDEQAKVQELGLRPADESIPVGSPIETGNGANPAATLVPVEVPDTLVIDRIGEVWHQVRKHAAIAVVFDKSGSMEGSKITFAVKGAQEFVNRMEPADTLLWIPFDDTVYPATSGRKSEVGEDLVSRIGGTPAGGGTALYDAVLDAYGQLTDLRAREGDSLRYGIVVLSDGMDQNSVSSLSQLESALAPSEADPTGIQIHTIAIGEDADQAVLKKIAGAAHGRFWLTDDERDVVNVYRDIAAYF
jgi:Ca-activated chloride channel family protein